MNRLAVIGSTGSIGRSTLAVAEAHPDRLRIVALAAGENASLLADQVARFAPAAVAMASDTALQSLDRELSARGTGRRPLAGAGSAGLVSIVTRPDVDTVLFASTGTASLEAVLAAIDAGKRIALANKEILVMAGGLVMDAARRRSVEVLPVDSEHNAIHQCLHGRDLRGRAPVDSDGVRRALPRPGGRRACGSDARRRAAPPDVEHGAEDHHRLGNAHE